jgi:hypothetical protein
MTGTPQASANIASKRGEFYVAPEDQSPGAAVCPRKSARAILATIQSVRVQVPSAEAAAIARRYTRYMRTSLRLSGPCKH